ncbi:nuclear receptor coactivator 7 isoform X1 [Ornithorhynchus anatinus]|uniref:nuclear receptor coactivator 7 isoform X1 n=1 Tax=Ornithorhynchus anatinus TaxID=9258 RepID=UPI000454AB2E|nr:nuclear receptor coactivator 7 isoform X1 [Ornithorhynchus anatinus]XP_028909973.1 nuclear receptor coactivator 7 isoform X1 [Ornithorhynchus anatinus]
MDAKEKKERRPGYFARLKKKRQTRQTAETTSAGPRGPSAGRTPPAKGDNRGGPMAEEADLTDEDGKKRKNSQLKDSRRTELKRYYNTDDNQNKTSEKKEKKMVVRKPHGSIEYTAGSQDTLNTIALKFNVTPNKLVELNKLFTHTIVPGQVLFVPDSDVPSAMQRLTSSSPGTTVSPLSSDAEYDKLPDADLARKALKPVERVLSSTSEDDEPVVVKFLKMNCRYFTDGKGVVGGVMIVTPNNIMFDPHKSDPLVIENGCEEYGLICPMEEVVSVALYNDISHMEIKDALPSDLPQDLCPLYRPGEWADLASEQDINPFSKFKSLGKEKRRPGEGQVPGERPDPGTAAPPAGAGPGRPPRRAEEPSLGTEGQPSRTKDHGLAGQDDDFVELEEFFPPAGGDGNTELKEVLDVEAHEKEDERPGEPPAEPDHAAALLDIHEGLDKVQLIEFYLSKNREGAGPPGPEREAAAASPSREPEEGAVPPDGPDPHPPCPLGPGEPGGPDAGLPRERESPPPDGDSSTAEEKDSSLPSSPDHSCQDRQADSQSEIQLWLLKRIQGPIEDMLPSKEEKSKTPPMFLCIKVGKPMRKSFSTQSTTMGQQYGHRKKQPEYWFAVPRERVDHLYTFFVQWSPEVYGKDAKEQGFVVVEKEELTMIDNFFSEPTTKSWEIITVEEAKRRKSTCSYYEEEEDTDALPILKQHSALLENMQIEQLAHRLPARVQGYPWRLAYSTLEHGTSLKTLYRKSASLDSPVLLVVKDMDNQVFGAYATHPFKFSDHYYGTGETFLYTFSPNFKVFKWSGENSYFINGDLSSLELGGGGGRFGLWLDADLYHGRSNSCSTFNNDVLSKKEDFIVQDLEVWTFE